MASSSVRPDVVSSAEVSASGTESAGSGKQGRSAGQKGSGKEKQRHVPKRRPSLVAVADDGVTRSGPVTRSSQDSPKLKEKVKRRRSQTKASQKKRSKTNPPVSVKVEEDQKPATATSTADEEQKCIEVPSLQVVWPILILLGFSYSNSASYSHPDIEQRFDTGQELRRFLCKNGIPNVGQLTEESKETLEQWVKFANVPQINDSVDVLSDDEVKAILTTLGFDVSPDKSVIFAPGASALFQNARVAMVKGVNYFSSLEEVRVYVRSNDVLAIGESGVRMTRSQVQTSSHEPLLRLWAALSDQPLPIFRPSNLPKKEEAKQEEVPDIQQRENADGSRVAVGSGGETLGTGRQAQPPIQGQEPEVKTDDASNAGTHHHHPPEKIEEYLALRKHIGIQRQLRDKNLADDGVPLKDDVPIPPTCPPEMDIDWAIDNLKRKLDHLRTENELFLE